MFFIYSAPLRSFKTFIEDIRSQFARYVSVYFEFGVKEVHIVFDDQNENILSPKSIERARRDDNEDKLIMAAEFEKKNQIFQENGQFF